VRQIGGTDRPHTATAVSSAKYVRSAEKLYHWSGRL